MTTPRKTTAMLIEKATLADFIENPTDNYYVLLEYKFMRLVKVEVTPSLPSPTLYLKHLDTLPNEPKLNHEAVPCVIHNLSECLFRLSPAPALPAPSQAAESSAPH